MEWDGIERGFCGHLRFYTEIVAYSPGLVAVLPIGLADGVYVVDADYPFILRELDFAAKVVHMADEGAQDFAVPRFCLRAHQVDDMLCEVGVESAGLVCRSVGAVCSHDVACCRRGYDGLV